MDLYTHIKTFNVVARCQSFSEASYHLNVVPSVIAKRIAQLEHVTKLKLFERTTRTLVITDAGKTFLARSHVLLQELEDLVSHQGDDAQELEGHIKILSPTTLALQHLNAVYNRFLVEHPKISLDVSLVDITISPMDDGFDIAVSGRPSVYEGAQEIALTPIYSRLYASPSYIEQHGMPKVPADLQQHVCLSFRPNGHTWHFPTSKGVSVVNFQPRLRLDDNVSLAHAVIQGLGIAALPYYIAKPWIEQGELVAVMPDCPLQETWFKMFIPKSKLKLPRVARMADMVHAYFHSAAWPREMP